MLQRVGLKLFGFQLTFLHVKLLYSMTKRFIAHVRRGGGGGEWKTGKMVDAHKIGTVLF